LESTEHLERQLRNQEDNRVKAESQRRREVEGSVEAVADEEFNRVKEQFAGLEAAQVEPILVNLRVAESLVPVAEAYDRAVRNVVAVVSEFNVKSRRKEFKVLLEEFDELRSLSTEVLGALRDVVARLDKFAGNLELERSVLLDVKAELNR
jgi:hypothetical protein